MSEESFDIEQQIIDRNYENYQERRNDDEN